MAIRVTWKAESRYKSSQEPICRLQIITAELAILFKIVFVNPHSLYRIYSGF